MDVILLYCFQADEFEYRFELRNLTCYQKDYIVVQFFLVQLLSFFYLGAINFQN